MFRSTLLGEACDKMCAAVSDSPVTKWLLKTVQILACILIVQTGALLWIASTLAKLGRPHVLL